MKPNQRVFVPGSEWLYFKFYTGVKTADKVIIDVFALIRQLINSDQVIKWFFIRYSDTDFHIRVRLLVKDKRLIGPIIDRFYIQLQPFVDNNLIWKIQLDTYNREMERYGNEVLINYAESVFYMDSECILLILEKMQEYGDEHYRWMIALKLVDSMLSDFSYDIAAKKELLYQLSIGFKTEFGFNKYNAKQFNHNYRDKKSLIERVMGDAIEDPNFLSLYPFIDKRSHQLKPIIEIIEKKITNVPDLKKESLISSFIHMTLNRLFRSKNRAHELIIYDMMYRCYNSIYARGKINS